MSICIINDPARMLDKRMVDMESAISPIFPRCEASLTKISNWIFHGKILLDILWNILLEIGTNSIGF